MFLFKLNTRFIIKVSELKFFNILDRMVRDSFKYVQCCLHHLLDTITEICILILRNISEGLGKTGKNSSLALFPVALYVSNCQAARSKLNYPSYIHYLSNFLVHISKFSEENERILTLILESFSTHTKALQTYAKEITANLLPALLERLQSENSDTRFLYLKIFADVVMPYLGDENTYDPYNTQRGLTRQLNEILVKRLTPAFSYLLVDTDPIPLYSLKLLSFILDRNVVFVNILKRHRLIEPLLDHFEVNEAKLNTHIVKIVKKIAECKDVSTDELNECSIVKKLNAVFRYITAKDQDWCLDLLMDIISDLLLKSVDSNRKNESMIEGFENQFAEPLLQNFTICTDLLSNADTAVVERSGICLALMLQLFGMSKSLYFTHECLPSLVSCLTSSRTPLQKKILRVLAQASRKNEFSLENRQIILGPLEILANDSDKTISSLASELITSLNG